MIKIYVRAIVPTENSYLLMADHDEKGEQTWDLPGGELAPGKDVRRYLRKLVLENTGYSIVNMQFYEIACRVRPRARGVNPMTVIDFIFSSKIEPVELQQGEKETELLRHEKFEWLNSDGRFRENKVMAILAKYHKQHVAAQEAEFSDEV